MQTIETREGMGYNNPMDKEETRIQKNVPEKAGNPEAQPVTPAQQPAYGMLDTTASPGCEAALGLPTAPGDVSNPPKGAGTAASTPQIPPHPENQAGLDPTPATATVSLSQNQARCDSTQAFVDPSNPQSGDTSAAASLPRILPDPENQAGLVPTPAAANLSPSPNESRSDPALAAANLSATPGEDGLKSAPATDSVVSPAGEDASNATSCISSFQGRETATATQGDASPSAPQREDAAVPGPLTSSASGQALEDLAADLADSDEDLDEWNQLEDLDDLDDGLDDLDDRYVWDARKQRLYEKKPPKERKPRSLFQWVAIGGCALVLILSVTGWFRNGQLLLPVVQGEPEQSESLPVVQEATPQQEEMEQAPVVQTDTEEAFVPTIILVEGEPIGTLASQEAAYSLLEDVKNYYGALAQEASPGELTVEVLEEVTFASAAPDALADGYESLYQLLTGEGSPITVRCTVMTKTSETLDYDTQEEKDKYLLEGTRIVEQMGREGASLTVTYTVYDNGRKRTSLSNTEEETIQPQDRVVRIGAQEVDPKAKPDEDTGRKGPDTQLTFQSPVAEGEVSLYFGQNQGSMHLGLDYKVGEEGQLTVLASCGGQVVSVMQRGGYGLVVEIDHGEGFLTRYAKLTSAQVALGDQVAAGQAIGLIQQAEGQNDAYLHFELRAGGEAYNPCFYLD